MLVQRGDDVQRLNETWIRVNLWPTRMPLSRCAPQSSACAYGLLTACSCRNKSGPHAFRYWPYFRDVLCSFDPHTTAPRFSSRPRIFGLRICV